MSERSERSLTRRDYDYRGTGRTIGLFYYHLGQRLERLLSLFAENLGFGPRETARKIMTRLDRIISNGVLRRRDTEYIRRNFDRLLKYAYDSLPPTRLLAMWRMILLFSSHPDIREYIPELADLMSSTIAQVTKSGFLDINDATMMSNYVRIVNTITTHNDSLLKFGSQLRRLHLAQPQWKEVAMGLIPYITHPELSYFALKYMLDFSKKEGNRDFLQLHKNNCNIRACQTCILHRTLFEHPRHSASTLIVAHPETFLAKLYSMIVYATKNLQYSAPSNLQDATNFSKPPEPIQIHCRTDTINERFFFGLWSAIASIIPSKQVAYEDGFEEDLARICSLGAAIFQMFRADATFEAQRLYVLRIAMRLVHALRSGHVHRDFLSGTWDDMESISHIHYSAERGRPLEGWAVLRNIKALLSSVERILEVIKSKHPGYGVLSPLYQMLSEAMDELDKVIARRNGLQNDMFQSAIHYLHGIGEPLPIDELKEICRRQICPTIPHKPRNLESRSIERDDLIDSLQYPLSLLFYDPNDDLFDRSNNEDSETTTIDKTEVDVTAVTDHTFSTKAPFYLRSYSGEIVRELWFETGPLSRVQNISALSLTTYSRHQGWVSTPEHGSWSWFEISILHGNNEEKDLSERIRRKRNNEPSSWTSHENSVESKGLERYDQHFDTHHEIWREILDGDSLGVIGCARQPGWCTIGQEAQLIFHLFDSHDVD